MNTTFSDTQSLQEQGNALLTKAAQHVSKAQTLRHQANKVKATAKAEQPSKTEVILSDAQLAEFQKVLYAKIAEACEEFDIDYTIGDMNVSDKRGIMTLGLRMVTKAYNALREANPYFRKRGQTQAEMRFENYYQSLGLRASDLHDRFKIQGSEFELLGLKGRNHKVVLRPIDTANHEPVEITLSDFFKATKRKPELAGA